jgi:hypothetical protein
MRGDVALLSLLLVLLLLGVPGSPNNRSSIKSGPLPLLAAITPRRLLLPLLLLLLLILGKLASGPPAALGATWLRMPGVGLGDSSGACRKLGLLPPLDALLPAAVAQRLKAADLSKHAAGCMRVRHGTLLLLLLLLLPPTRRVPLGFPCTAQTRHHAV